MINYINKFRKTDARRGVSRGRKADRSSDLPLDRRLSYDPYPDEHWTYEDDGRIYLNGVDMQEMIDEERDDIQFLCGTSRGLNHYQRHVWSRGGKDKADFNARVNALQDKIHGRLGDIYDTLTGGVNFELQEGEFWINGVNVRKVINLFYQRPSENARRYLMTLRDKLGLILSRRRSSKRYDGVHKRVDLLFRDVNLALEYIPADAPPRLVGHRRIA